MENDKPTEETEEKKPEVKLRDLTPEKDAKGGGGVKPSGSTKPDGGIKPSGSTSVDSSSAS